MLHLSAVMLLTPSLKTVCNICTEQVRVAVLKQSLNVCSPSAVSCIFFSSDINLNVFLKHFAMFSP